VKAGQQAIYWLLLPSCFPAQGVLVLLLPLLLVLLLPLLLVLVLVHYLGAAVSVYPCCWWQPSCW
jgi:hypothetical protein